MNQRNYYKTGSLTLSPVYTYDFNLDWESGLTLTACKQTKWIALIYTLNPDSIRFQPISGGGLLNPIWDLD